MKIKKYYKENKYIRYSNCHEDALFVLNNIKGEPKNILSIASALDNSLALLLTNPEKVVAIDSNITQVYLCKLKKCGIKYLTYQDFLVLIGVEKGDSYAIYEKLKQYLDSEETNYFDNHKYLISDYKLVNCGRFEYYFNVFKNKVLPLLHSKKTVQKFMSFASLQEQREFYYSKFNNLRFRFMFKMFFSRFVMQKIGRDKACFKYNKGSISKMLKTKVEIGFCNNLNVQNPYAQYALLNKFNELPLYLKKENFEIIKQRIDRLKIKYVEFKEEIKQDNKYDFMYLSDIFEYMDNKTTKDLSGDIYNALNTNGQVLFFNMMNERRFGEAFLEEKLDQKNDRAFYYTACYSYLKK